MSLALGGLMLGHLVALLGLCSAYALGGDPRGVGPVPASACAGVARGPVQALAAVLVNFLFLAAGQAADLLPEAGLDLGLLDDSHDAWGELANDDDARFIHQTICLLRDIHLWKEPIQAELDVLVKSGTIRKVKASQLPAEPGFDQWPCSSQDDFPDDQITCQKSARHGSSFVATWFIPLIMSEVVGKLAQSCAPMELHDEPPWCRVLFNDYKLNGPAQILNGFVSEDGLNCCGMQLRWQGSTLLLSQLDFTLELIERHGPVPSKQAPLPRAEGLPEQEGEHRHRPHGHQAMPAAAGNLITKSLKKVLQFKMQSPCSRMHLMLPRNFVDTKVCWRFAQKPS
eukprot:s140_g55.t1